MNPNNSARSVLSGPAMWTEIWGLLSEVPAGRDGVSFAHSAWKWLPVIRKIWFIKDKVHE